MKKYLIILFFILGCAPDDGSTIKTITVGNDEWMTENAGDYLTWGQAMDACPKGFKLPSQTDFEYLITSNNNILQNTRLGFKNTNGQIFLNSEWGYYWSSSVVNASGSWAFVFDNDEMFLSGSGRDIRMCVRCIKE